MQAQPLVVVVDDDERVCKSVGRLLTTRGYRVRTFNSAREYLSERDAMEPACVVADIRMPEVDGLAMHREVRALGIDVPTVFITGSGDVEAVVSAMKLGASDLLEKPFDDVTLLAAIDTAIEKGRHERDERRSLAELWRLLDSLTSREAEVCALVASGRLNKQIAAAIGTTEKTVKVHRARVMTKLHVQSVAELVRVVDRVLSESSPATIVGDDRRQLARPRAVEIMATTLGRDVRELSPLPPDARARSVMDQGPMHSESAARLT